MKKFNKERGITLVALIITIIVLLILAVVTIAAVTGDSIINHAENARDSYRTGMETENSMLKTYEERLATEAAKANGNTKEWEFAENGDKDASGTVTVGDLIQPTKAGVTTEKFYVINTSNANTFTLLAEKCVKTSAGEGQWMQNGNANTVAFDDSTNVYASSDIKDLVDTYVSKLTEAGLTLEDVETAEGENAVTGVKGRLMWGTDSIGEVKNLLDRGFNDLVKGPIGAKLQYWIGSPAGNNEWMVNGEGDTDNVTEDYVNESYGLRPVIVISKSKI